MHLSDQDLGVDRKILVRMASIVLVYRVTVCVLLILLEGEIRAYLLRAIFRTNLTMQSYSNRIV